MVAVLALHGWLGRGEDWGSVAARLDPDITVLAPDLPGHGHGPLVGSITMDAVAEQLVRLVDEAAVDRAVIAGYSMGGRVALHLALENPERVAGLVLVSASAGLRTEDERAARRAADAARGTALLRDPPAFVRDWYNAPLFDPLTPAQRAALAADRVANGRPERWAAALSGLSTGAQPWHGDRLREIRVPTAVLAGAVDAKFAAIASEMAAAGGFACSIVPGAGHALLVERPDIVASAIVDVVAAAGPASS